MPNYSNIKDHGGGFSVNNEYLLSRITDFVDPRGDEKILDFGCGRGDALIFLRKHSICYGVDNSPEYLTAARERGINNLFLFDIEREPRLSFDDDFFDKIFCFHVLEHINADLHSFLFREFSRLLKKDGSLIIGVPVFSFTARSLFLIRRLFNPEIVDHFGSTVHKNRFTLKRLFKLLSENGYYFSGKCLKNVVVQDKLNFKNKSYYNFLFMAPICLDILAEFKKGWTT